MANPKKFPRSSATVDPGTRDRRVLSEYSVRIIHRTEYVVGMAMAGRKSWERADRQHKPLPRGGRSAIRCSMLYPGVGCVYR